MKMNIVMVYEIVRFDENLKEVETGLQCQRADDAEKTVIRLMEEKPGVYYSFRVKNYFIPA